MSRQAAKDDTALHLIEQLKTRLVFLGISQRELARRLEVSGVHVCNLLGGHCPQVSAAMIERIAREVGLRLILIPETRSNGKATAKKVQSMRTKKLARSNRKGSSRDD